MLENLWKDLSSEQAALTESALRIATAEKLGIHREDVDISCLHGRCERRISPDGEEFFIDGESILMVKRFNSLPLYVGVKNLVGGIEILFTGPKNET